MIVSALLHFSSDKFADPDGFYHFRHAALYGEGNLFSPAFPWIPFSVIGKYSADIWYGFHVLLIPFTWIGDPVLAMRLAGVGLTWAFLLTIYCACVKLDLKPAWLGHLHCWYPRRFDCTASPCYGRKCSRSD